jgi:spore maturation protein A
MGIGKLMERTGMTRILSKMMMPLLSKLFPTCRKDPIARHYLSANICANILGLGNAATPMGIQAAKRLASHAKPGFASNELCRLIVLNTASIQLIPTNIAAVRVNHGCATPFDILPAVWITSICSAGSGLLVAWLLGKVFRHD